MKDLFLDKISNKSLKIGLYGLCDARQWHRFGELS